MSITDGSSKLEDKDDEPEDKGKTEGKEGYPSATNCYLVRANSKRVIL